MVGSCTVGQARLARLLSSRARHSDGRSYAGVVRGLAPTERGLLGAMRATRDAVKSLQGSRQVDEGRATAVEHAVAAVLGAHTSGTATPSTLFEATPDWCDAMAALTTDEMRALEGQLLFDIPMFGTLDPDSIEALMLNVDAGALSMLESLAACVAIPSVSDDASLPNPKAQECARWLVDYLRDDVGIPDVELVEVDGSNPTVLASHFHGADKPTVWLYAHYDDQPADGNVGWHTKPFTATVNGERLFGRGTADDKAGIFVATEAYQALKGSPMFEEVNWVFVFEGEEEIGSPNLPAILDHIKDKVPAPDTVIVTDSKTVAPGVPTTSLAARGAFGLTLELSTAAFGAHSGFNVFVPNAMLMLSRLVDQALDDHFGLSVDGLTTAVPPLPSRILESMAAFAGDEPAAFATMLREASGMFAGVPFVGDPQQAILERVGGAFSLSELASQGPQTIDHPAGMTIPWARKLLQVRVPPGMDAGAACQQLITAYQRHAERLQYVRDDGAGVRLTIEPGHSVQPWQGDVNHPYVDAIGGAMAAGFGRPGVFDAMGGSIGILHLLKRMYPDAAIFPIGIEDPYTNAHAANESLLMDQLVDVGRTLVHFIHGIAQHHVART